MPPTAVAVVFGEGQSKHRRTIEAGEPEETMILTAFREPDKAIISMALSIPALSGGTAQTKVTAQRGPSLGDSTSNPLPRGAIP